MSRWFRWYEKTTEDGKFRVVTRMSRVTLRDTIAVWAAILEDAASLEHRGVFKNGEAYLTSVLDFEDGVVSRILQAMQDTGMLSASDDGMVVTNWAKRQFESDTDPTAAERQRQKRERDKLKAESQKAPETSVSRVTNAPTEDRVHNSESKKKVIPAKAGYTPDFEQFWKAYPRNKNMSKPDAFVVWTTLSKSGELPELPRLLIAIAGYKSFMASEEKNGGKPYSVKHCDGWLKGRRWEPYLEDAAKETSQATHAADWADSIPAWAGFKPSVHPTVWANLFAICKPNGSPSTLIAPSSFVRDQIESRYGKTLDTIFNGEFQVKTENHP